MQNLHSPVQLIRTCVRRAGRCRRHWGGPGQRDEPRGLGLQPSQSRAGLRDGGAGAEVQALNPGSLPDPQGEQTPSLRRRMGEGFPGEHVAPTATDLGGQVPGRVLGQLCARWTGLDRLRPPDRAAVAACQDPRSEGPHRRIWGRLSRAAGTVQDTEDAGPWGQERQRGRHTRAGSRRGAWRGGRRACGSPCRQAAQRLGAGLSGPGRSLP